MAVLLGSCKGLCGGFWEKGPRKALFSSLSRRGAFLCRPIREGWGGEGGACEVGQTSRQRLVLFWACEVSRADVVAMEREKLRSQRE